MRKGRFIAGNFLLIFCACLFYFLQLDSAYSTTVFDYLFYCFVILVFFVSLFLILLNAGINWRRKYSLLFASVATALIISISSIIQSEKLMNAEILFEAVDNGDGMGGVIIVLRTDSTYKIEDLGMLGNDYYYGSYKILKDTLVLNPPSPNDLFASGRFLITTDTLFEFGNEGPLITIPDYTYEIFSGGSKD